jgi:hypothetical protein
MPELSAFTGGTVGGLRNLLRAEGLVDLAVSVAACADASAARTRGDPVVARCLAPTRP